MKKILALILALAIQILFVACSGVYNSAGESNSGVSTSLPTALTAEGKALFEGIFVELSEQVGIMTYENCVTYMDSSDFEYETVEPSDEDIGRITVTEDNGFKLSIHFDPNDDGAYTISLLSYSNGDYEGYVKDSCHMIPVKYGIYDVTADPKNTAVESLDQVVSFILNDVPIKIEQYENSVSENTEIEVTLDVGYVIVGGKVFFTVNTNLPDETTLMLTLSNGDFKGQTEVTIINGTATSEGFSNKGRALSGHYTLKVSMSLAKLQSDAVVKIIGTQGEYLTGQYVQESSLGSGNVVSGTFEFDF